MLSSFSYWLKSSGTTGAMIKQRSITPSMLFLSSIEFNVICIFNPPIIKYVVIDTIHNPANHILTIQIHPQQKTSLFLLFHLPKGIFSHTHQIPSQWSHHRIEFYTKALPIHLLLHFS